MTIKQFIEKAIEGGWKDLHAFVHYNGAWVGVELKDMCWRPDDEGHDEQVHQTTQFKLAEILLDPLAWQAVGKVEGWNTLSDLHLYSNGTNRKITDAEMNHHLLLTALWDGKTIEQYLETL